jgi:hypothetical protein
MHKSLIVAASLLSAGYSYSPRAAECPGKDCPPPKPREVCFNVYCQFKKSDSSEQKCHAASRFIKAVNDDGSEIEDTATPDSFPVLEIECDERVIYNNGGHRFTDFTGTRIQSEAGPYPALVLPKGALREPHHMSTARLELEEETYRGECYIYMGQW